jgi:hypothetical protein
MESLNKEYFQIVHADSGYPLSLDYPNDFPNLETARETAAQEAAGRLDGVTVVRVTREEMCTFVRTITVQETTAP